ncbi:hypothetical protein P4H66_19525 [Paenibacillus dokdonensis]|uniref:Uncharacterized protein n=1 Tax=Paenibacillus dokdonensis TaxID=2567944 RepID=A0ABU6GQI2_9BACL|nr:hypothetical protein [Paenibacillus dokdonensis]MEC0241997.1 hypothetical protein [Paenibacillus dokdonensis]
MEDKRDWQADMPIKRGNSVRLTDGTIHEISSIQHVHDRYQLVGVSGWQYGIDQLKVEQPHAAYRYWQDKAAAERERAHQAELLIDNLGGGDRYRYIRHVRKELEDQITLLVEHIIEVEAREQKLKEAIEQSMELGMLEYAPYTYEHFEETLSTLYPKETTE